VTPLSGVPPLDNSCGRETHSLRPLPIGTIVSEYRRPVASTAAHPIADPPKGVPGAGQRHAMPERTVSGAMECAGDQPLPFQTYVWPLPSVARQTPGVAHDSEVSS
jgi:hypothetical protein